MLSKSKPDALLTAILLVYLHYGLCLSRVSDSLTRQWWLVDRRTLLARIPGLRVCECLSERAEAIARTPGGSEAPWYDAPGGLATAILLGSLH